MQYNRRFILYGGIVPPFGGAYFESRIKEALYKVPPIGTRGVDTAPRPEKGSRAQSTTAHKNDTEGLGYITRRLYPEVESTAQMT